MVLRIFLFLILLIQTGLFAGPRSALQAEAQELNRLTFLIRDGHFDEVRMKLRAWIEQGVDFESFEREFGRSNLEYYLSKNPPDTDAEIAELKQLVEKFIENGSQGRDFVEVARFLEGIKRQSLPYVDILQILKEDSFKYLIELSTRKIDMRQAGREGFWIRREYALRNSADVKHLILELQKIDAGKQNKESLDLIYTEVAILASQQGRFDFKGDRGTLRALLARANLSDLEKAKIYSQDASDFNEQDWKYLQNLIDGNVTQSTFHSGKLKFVYGLESAHFDSPVKDKMIELLLWQLENGGFSSGIHNSYDRSWVEEAPIQKWIDQKLKDFGFRRGFSLFSANQLTPSTFKWFLRNKIWADRDDLEEFVEHYQSQLKRKRKGKYDYFLAIGELLNGQYDENDVLGSYLAEEELRYISFLDSRKLPSSAKITLGGALVRSGNKNFESRLLQVLDADDGSPEFRDLALKILVHAKSSSVHVLRKDPLFHTRLLTEPHNIRDEFKSFDFYNRGSHRILSSDIVKAYEREFGEIDLAQTCEQLCQTAYKLASKKSTEQFSGTRLAELSMKFYFISQMADKCESAQHGKELKRLAETVETILTDPVFRGFIGGKSTKLKIPRKKYLEYARTLVDHPELTEWVQLMANQSHRRSREAGVYNQQWLKAVKDLYGVSLSPGETRNFKYGVLDARELSLDPGGSNFSTYAMATAAIHTLDRYPGSFTQESAQGMVNELLYYSLKAPKPGYLGYKPTSEYDPPDSSNSFGRNLPVYLAIYRHSEGAVKDYARNALIHAIIGFERALGDMAVFGNHDGVHIGNDFKSGERSRDGRAPYYYYGAFPYYAMAQYLIAQDDQLDEFEKKYFKNNAVTTEKFMRILLANDSDSIEIYKGPKHYDHSHANYTGLTGIGLLGLSLSCGENGQLHSLLQDESATVLVGGELPSKSKVKSTQVDILRRSPSEFQRMIDAPQGANSHPFIRRKWLSPARSFSPSPSSK